LCSVVFWIIQDTLVCQHIPESNPQIYDNSLIRIDAIPIK